MKHEIGSRPYVVLCPGADWQGLLIGPKELADAYGVQLADCLVFDPSRTWGGNTTGLSNWRPWPWDVCLYPALKGEKYELPEKAREILRKYAG